MSERAECLECGRPLDMDTMFAACEIDGKVIGFVCYGCYCGLSGEGAYDIPTGARLN
jgi:hypothetical protein